MGRTATGYGFVDVTLSDTVNVAKNAAGNWPRAVYFGVGGTAKIVAPDDSVGTFIVSAGQTVDCDFKRINATGSATVASMVGIY